MNEKEYLQQLVDQEWAAGSEQAVLVDEIKRLNCELDWSTRVAQICLVSKATIAKSLHASQVALEEMLKERE